MASWVAPLAVVLLSLGGGLMLDHDGDGVAGWRELDAGTSLLRGDTDGDGLSDGYEARHGLPADRSDADGDGLDDGREQAAGSDPLSHDSDGDGIPDAREPDEDCDGDGRPAVATSDDDGDGRPDAEEPPDQRCRADVDGDGVPDGSEGHPDCVVSADCDVDGLDDALEVDAGYDPLDPDTFGTGLPDAVAYAFEAGGQPPGADADRDGIPDPWEEQGGLVDWGDLRPEPGAPDLLVEFVRVVGPDSEEYGTLPFDGAYRDVAGLFATRGITLRWVETTVGLDEEVRPDVLTPESLDHYDAVLAASRHAHNPFVTSFILNPQQVQEHAGHVLGAAFLRSMLASADYGAHTDLTFENPELGTLIVSPVYESHIATGDQAKVRALGFEDGGVRPPRIFLRDDDGSHLGAPGTLTWVPDWFAQPPSIEYDELGTYAFTRGPSTVRQDELASTIAHELGHTLGLCHAHDADCYAAFSPADQADRHQSTMSYAAPEDALHFLDSEWAQVEDYLRCPPETTVRLVADGAPPEALRSAKYQTSFLELGSQRACGDLDARPVLFAAEAPTHYDATLPDPPAVHVGGGWLLAQAVLTALAAVAARRIPARP